MLGAAMLAGIAGLGAGTAQAAEVRVIARGPVATALPYAGPGHVLAAGYRVNGRWNRGYRRFRGPAVRGYVRFGHGRVYGRGYYGGRRGFRR